MNEKVCTKCNTSKEFKDFCKKRDKEGNSCPTSICKICYNTYRRVYRNIDNKGSRPRGVPKHDLKDKRFGYLVACFPTRTNCTDKGGNRGWFWMCKCDCGNSKEVSNYLLLKGHTKSCGCQSYLRKELSNNWKGYKDITGTFWKQIRDGAKVRNLEFSITIEYIWNLFIKQEKKCALSGIEIFMSTSTEDRMNKKTTVSLDRIDSKLGYIEGNVQWVHKMINKMKQGFDQNEFILMCKDIAKYNEKT